MSETPRSYLIAFVLLAFGVLIGFRLKTEVRARS